MATTTAVVDAPSSDSSPSFAELGVRPEIVTALAERGITHTFAIQELTLPLALGGSDLIGQARTGMGKTYGFGVPLLHRISTGEASELDGTPRALVIVPPVSCASSHPGPQIASTGLTAPRRGTAVKPDLRRHPVRTTDRGSAKGVDWSWAPRPPARPGQR